MRPPLLVVLLLVALPVSLVLAREDAPRIQEIEGYFAPANGRFLYYDLFNLNAGQTLYIYLESGEFDPYLVFCDIDCEETFAENDDIDYADGNTNAAIEIQIPATGDYSIAIADCCDETAEGVFRLLIGLNAPAVLTGSAEPTGDELAVPYLLDDMTVGGYDRSGAADCSQLQERPTLSGPAQTWETDHFVMHYTEEGQDRATPWFVEQVASAMEDVYLVQIMVRGWPMPPPDCGEGGDERFDVYLIDVVGREDILGYAMPGGIIGDNPQSSVVEEWSAYSYIVLDNDFRGTGQQPIPLMRATAAHEFHHTIQFGYDVGDLLNWYYEATSVWMETQTFVKDEAATPYVDDYFDTTDVCIGASSPRLRIYSEWLLIDTLVEDYGLAVVPQLWDRVAEYEGMEPLYRLLDDLGTTPQAFMQRVAVRNLLLDYALGHRFAATVRAEAIVTINGKYTPSETGVQQLGVDYIRLDQRRQYRFAVEPSNLVMLVVGIDPILKEAVVFELAQTGVVDTTPFSDAYLLVLNTDAHEDPDDCVMTDWTLIVGDGKGQTVAPIRRYDASRYKSLD